LAWQEEVGSRFKTISFEDFFPFNGAVKIDGAAGAGPFAQGAPIFPHFITGPPGELKRSTGIFFGAIKDIPTRSQDHQVAQASQGKAAIVDQSVDLVDLGDIKMGIKPVIGVLLPQGFDKPFFFIFPDALLGEVDQAGNLVDQKEVPCISFATGRFGFSSRHKSCL
jgi:hypothetical protein